MTSYDTALPQMELLQKIEQEPARVLVVDDDRLVLMALEQTIKQEGYEVITAQNGEEAIEVLRNQTIALIICDQRMPGMTGVEVMQKVQEMQPDTIRIILTGNNEQKTAIEAINVGKVSQFIVKPWDDAHIRQTVHSSIRQYKLTKENQSLHNLLLEQHKALAETHHGLRRELLLGGKIHETMLLGAVPKHVPGMTVDATTIASKDIDGDFYDFYQPTRGILDVVIGDVMGKGIPAAVVGTAVKTHLMRFATPVSRAQVFDKLGLWQEDLLSPWEILSNVHREIAKQLMHLEFFVCLFYGRFNLIKRTFTYVDCGSAKPMHYSAKTKKATQLKGANFPLGMVDHDHYNVTETFFGQDDFFVFYSDGVTESRNADGELFGTDRLEKLIESHCDRSAAELLTMIKQATLDFTDKEELDDDLTVIVVKIDDINCLAAGSPTVAKFSSDLGQLKAVRDFVDRLCIKAPGDSERLSNELQLVINETFCNIVKHGYNSNKEGMIVIKGDFSDGGIVLEVSDQGNAFRPDEVLEPSLAGDQDDGFGWHIIRTITDQVVYVPKVDDGGWNHLRIFKHYYSKGDIMELTHEERDNVLVIRMESENLDAKDAPDFKQRVIDAIATSDTHWVVIDLSQLKFIDSSGLGSFLAVLRVLNSQGGDLKLAGMNKTVRTMFELVSMHKIFEIYNTVDDAVRSYKTMKTTN
ncbi:MAG: anti-sigma factor antagonist [Chlamydiales bacterium]|nr:anti-sigma factor antagonist [Chlamydiia bacterium]MCP5507957.1 anti-sigma factor antagonist [Chlamydiales bacterium]